MKSALVCVLAVSMPSSAIAQVDVQVRMEQGANGVLTPVTPDPSSTLEIWDCISVGLPYGLGSAQLNYNVQDFGVNLEINWTDTPTEALTTGCGFFPVCPVPSIDACGPQVTERIDYGVIRGGMSVYSVAAGGGFSGGASYTRIAEGSFVWNEPLEVFAPQPMTIRLPITVSGSVSGAESFGNPASTWGKAELTITGTALGSPVNATVSVESVSVIPTQASIAQVEEVFAFVPAGTTQFSVNLTGRGRVEARAESAGLFGTITGAATAIADFPNSLRLGRITLDDGRPLPAGTVVRGLNSGIYYEGVAPGIPVPASFCTCSVGAPCNNFFAAGGCANSSGVGVELSASGPSSFALDTLILRTTGVPSAGLIFMGRGSTQLPFGDGRRCVASPLYRFPLQNAGPSGIKIGPGLVAQSSSQLGGNAIAPGDTWYFQAWYRDGAGPCGSGANTSNGISVTFYP